ncbi:integrator complex subunit 6 homolog [Saccostrea cucullata]|uniref:integrator complex subunit 6 homolog n=1 Tax=Saccostrea cuccullata TaxID=36930 RepID=UPI002ED22A3E
MFESANEKFKIGPLNNSPYPMLGDDQNKITNAYIEDFKTVGFGRKDSQKYPWYNNPFDPRMSFHGFQHCLFKQQDEKDNEQTKARLTENVFLALDNPSAVMNDYLYGYREYLKNLSGLPTIHIGSGDDPGDIVHDDGSQECKRLFQRIRSQSVRSVFPMENEALENAALGKALTETNCQLTENHSQPDRMDQLCLNPSPDLSKYQTGNANESLLQKSLEKLCDGIAEEAKETDQILIPTSRAAVNKPQTPPGFSSKNLANNGGCFETAHVINETVTKDSTLEEKTFNQYFLTKDKHVTDDSSHLQKERKAAEKIHQSSSSMSRNLQEAVAKLIPEEVHDTKLTSGQPDKHIPSGQPNKNLPSEQPDTEIPKSGQPDKNLPSAQPHEKLPTEQPDKNLPSGQPDKNLQSGQPDKSSPSGHPGKNLPSGQTQVQQPTEEEQSKDKKITHLSDISGGTTPVSKESSNSSWAEKLFYKDVNGKEKCSKEGKSSLENNKVNVAEKASKTIKSNLRPNSEPFIPPSLASKSNNALQVQNKTLFTHEDFQPRHYAQNLVPHAQNNYLPNIQPAPYPQQLPSQSLYFPTNVPPPPVHGLAPVIAQQNYRNPHEAFQNANWFNDNGVVAPPDYKRYQFQPPLQSPLIPSVVQNNQLFNQNYPYNQGLLNYNTPDNLLPHDMTTNVMSVYIRSTAFMSSTFQQKNQPQHLYAFRESRNSFPYNFNNNNTTNDNNNNNNNNSLSDRSASCLETEERVIPRIEFRRSRSCEDLVLDGFKGRARPRAIRSNLIRIYPTNS